jgi:type I restriction enzyme S subunit
VSTLLKFARFKDFYIWDVKRNLSSLIYSDYEIVTLGHYIQEEKAKVKPFEYPNDDFKILGVSNKIGLFDNEIKKGKDINQAYKIVKDGFLAFNPYRINVGSIGLKTKEQKNDLISPAYVVFSCKKELLPEYLFLIFKTDIFNEIIRANTKGSVRQTLSYEILESLKIPLPPLEVQKELIKEYQDRLDLANIQEQQAKDKKKEIEEYLYKELGIEIIKGNSKDSILNFVRFKDLLHWGVSKQDNILFASKYNLIKLDECCYDFKNGVNFNKSQFGKGNKFINIKDVYSDKFVDLESLDKITIDKNKLNSNLINNNDLVFVRSSVKYEGVGYPSLIKINDANEKITFCGFIIKCSINTNIINPDFLLFILRSSIFRNIVIERSNKSTITNIAQPSLKSLDIPLPPLEIQNTIANIIQIQKDEVLILKEQFIQNKTLALKEFENKVFNEA